MKQWQEEYHASHIRDPDGGFTYQCDAGEAVIPPDITIKVLRQYYFWPGLAKWVEEYMQGCATC